MEWERPTGWQRAAGSCGDGEPLLTPAEKSTQTRHIILIGAKLDGIDAPLSEKAVLLGSSALNPASDLGPDAAIARIPLDLPARLGVLERHPADRRQLLLARIDDRDRD